MHRNNQHCGWKVCGIMFLLAANAAAQGTTPRLNPPSSNPPIANPYPGPSGAMSQPSSSQLVRRYLGVPTETFVETRRELMRMFLMRLQVDAQNVDLHTLPTSSGKLAILFDQQRQDILVEGPANLVGQFSTLVEATYQRHRQGNSPEASHRVLLLQRTNRDELIRAMQSAPKPGPRDGTANGPAWLGMRPASFTKQPPQDPNPPVNPPQLGPPDASSIQDPNRPRLPQFDGVQIESLPDLDAIILRGPKCGTRPTRRDYQTIGRSESADATNHRNRHLGMDRRRSNCGHHRKESGIPKRNATREGLCRAARRHQLAVGDWLGRRRWRPPKI